jgi:hemoglobin
VVSDPELTHYFSLTDMAALRRHQVEMLSAATGGPRQYTGQDIAAAHEGLAITGADFGNVVGHLIASLQGFNVEPDVIGRVIETLAPLKSSIVNS